MTAHDPGLRATRHWRDRVQQRIGPDVDPDALARILGMQIAADSGHVEYRGRVHRDGRRLFAFAMPDGRRFVALVCTGTNTAITVMPEDFTVPRHARCAR